MVKKEVWMNKVMVAMVKGVLEKVVQGKIVGMVIICLQYKYTSENHSIGALQFILRKYSCLKPHTKWLKMLLKL